MSRTGVYLALAHPEAETEGYRGRAEVSVSSHICLLARPREEMKAKVGEIKFSHLSSFSLKPLVYVHLPGWWVSRRHLLLCQSGEAPHSSPYPPCPVFSILLVHCLYPDKSNSYFHGTYMNIYMNMNRHVCMHVIWDPHVRENMGYLFP